MLDRLKSWWQDLDPWLYMVTALGVLAVLGLSRHGVTNTLPQLVVGGAVAGLIDFFYHGLVKKHWFFPLSATISGLICALVLPVDKPVAVGLAAALAMIIKRALVIQDRHIFNPAAIGSVLVARWQGLALGWWGESFVWVTIILGLGNIIKIHRYPQVLSALVSYTVALYLSRLSITYVNSSALVETLQDIPWFFLLYMVPEPKTSLRPVVHQLIFGLVVGLTSVGFSYTPFRDYTLIYSLLTANLVATFFRHQAADRLGGRRVKIT